MSTHTLEQPSESTEAETPVKVVGLLAQFEDVSSVMSAAKKVRDAGYKYWDVHSPFPIHGIDEAMGVRPTILPILVFIGGFTGCCVGILMTWWINAASVKPPAPFDWVNFQGYQFLISGKPLWSLPANVPVIFECTVLFSALTTVFGMLGLNKLPMFYNPLFKLERFRRVTNDKFFIVIDAGDPHYDEKDTLALLTSSGASAVETVDE